MHNNYLSVWSMLYCDISQALYSAISRLFMNSYKQDTKAYSATYFKYKKTVGDESFPIQHTVWIKCWNFIHI